MRLHRSTARLTPTFVFHTIILLVDCNCTTDYDTLRRPCLAAICDNWVLRYLPHSALLLSPSPPAHLLSSLLPAPSPRYHAAILSRSFSHLNSLSAVTRTQAPSPPEHRQVKVHSSHTHARCRYTAIITTTSPGVWLRPCPNLSSCYNISQCERIITCFHSCLLSPTFPFVLEYWHV